MAETWNKKEREKKKRQIRKEKAERRSNRSESSESGNNLDSMIAYLDEDGNLSSTPPDPKKKTTKVSDDINHLPVG